MVDNILRLLIKQDQINVIFLFKLEHVIHVYKFYTGENPP